MDSKTSDKKPAKIQHLINWYFGNFCAKCGKIDSEQEEFGKKCYNKLLTIQDNVNADQMTHKEFVNLVRNTSFCHPSTRHFDDCATCKKFRINNNYWIRNWDGWNLNTLHLDNP